MAALHLEPSGADGALAQAAVDVDLRAHLVFGAVDLADADRRGHLGHAADQDLGDAHALAGRALQGGTGLGHGTLLGSG